MRASRISLVVLAASVLAAPRFTQSREVEIELPPETGTFKAGEGAPLAQTFCLTCHSTEYVSIQPPMPAKFWDAEVKKMREKYGAPVPPQLDAAIVAYLVKVYGVADEK